MKKALALAVLVLLLLLTGCGRVSYKDVPNPVATITMMNGDTMCFELMLSEAPITVANFTVLANEGFYDGLEFYRVVPGVLIQSGAPGNDPGAAADYTILGEFSENGYANGVSHQRGTISMCRQSEDYNSASTQFFILQGNYPEYDGFYAAFGRAMDEMTLETIDRIASKPVDANYLPFDRQYIGTIRVETFGYTFAPEKIEKEKEGN